LSKVVAVIPVRYGAQRFPGKPLASLLGKPMIQWVVEGVSQSQNLDALVVATDHDEIANCVRDFAKSLALNVEIVMTDSDLPTGSDRVWQAVKGRTEPLVLNIQGDEPLIQGVLVDQMLEAMKSSPDWDMLTLGRAMDPLAFESHNTAKIVLNHKNQALYFSRLGIPYSRNASDNDYGTCLKHVGLYGYKRAFLEKFCQQEPTDLERYEGLEQLRALYIGARIQVLKTDYESWGVDTPEDIPRLEEKLRTMYGQK